ncbi:MAG: LLM class flavin-dependent oxidoreductase [Ilumatobacter sp.]|uniref:LLM class flavin-dependent oxidoreductase n=1 Tax=Ilumatobacter sp. TaxID=1967498 RepID=UPI00391BF704
MISHDEGSRSPVGEPFTDRTVDKFASPLLDPDRFGLAVFSSNMAGGANLTDATGPPRVTWPETVRIAQAADRHGFDAIIPVARWRSPSTTERAAAHRSFETFTWAAGLAAVTERIGVFATFHVPTVHPVRAAKEIATVDHISGGRLGVNVVAGWNAADFQMFGFELDEHDDRYGVADEWMEFLERIFEGEHPFDFDGAHFRSREVVSEPRPVQTPAPVVMSAGFSPAGRAFAARRADINFVITPDRGAAKTAIAEVKRVASDVHGRRLSVFGAAHILCRDSDAAAQAEYRRVVHEHGDWAGARAALASLMGGSQSADFALEMQEAAIFGFFATPIVGSPDHVVEQLLDMRADGLDGAAVSWVDYEEGIEQYGEVLAPLLAEAGLRPGG